MVDVAILFIYKIVLGILPFAGTLLLGYIAFKVWVHYIRQDFISGIEFVVLEVIPPRDVERSPLAMELFISNALFHWSMKGGREEYWQGAVWFWFSLEIVSIEGQVHFYIRTPSRIRTLIETQMYAQYPQAQVKVVEDYTLAVDEITPSSAWNAWGCEFRLTKHQAFPIKTYADYGLDIDPDEELKVDPISPVIEFFSSLQRGEQGWLQIVITPSKKMYHDRSNPTFNQKASFFGKHDWVQESRDEILRFTTPYTNIRAWDKDTVHRGVEVRVPKYLDKTIEGMSKKTGKLGFETGVRLMYIAKKEVFPVGRRTNNSRNIRLVLRQYAKPDCNEFYRFNSTQGDALGSSIMPLSSRQVMHLANRMLHEYRERAFFHLPLRHHIFSESRAYFSQFWLWAPVMLIVKRFFLPYFHHLTYVLNTEEIATLWHFPGQILKVPTLERIESKEASPPPNLPV
ncbi:hypothetical protein A3I95_00985 [Candidatus Nomurabacteria bacterium RIFCSPLOWO2_02_FULL_44_12]|nr:MAG: hypothetical protein A3I95_00985 [Candidatus Nomurabacteria bacterium RIFCSPLOWO2_02_FULL_44_12]